MDRKTFCRGLIAAAGVAALGGCSRRPRITVGSKNFTEQLILGEIVAQHIERRLELSVTRKLGLGGTLLAHQALLSKEIDLYPEYTGTAFTNVLKQREITDPQLVLERVRSQYASELQLDWLDPLGFNNSFAMVVRGQDARDRRLQTLTDAANDPTGFALGAGYEFEQRPDGFGTLSTGYRIHWLAPIKTMDLGLLYPALQQKQVSMIAANMTDGLITKLDVTVLQDDKHVFPPYQACMVARSDVMQTIPRLRQTLAELSGRITTEAMRRMNFHVDSEHRQPSSVAAEFLKTV